MGATESVTVAVPNAQPIDIVVSTRYTPTPGLLRIGPEPERAIAMTDRGYSLILPRPSSDSPEGAARGTSVRGVVLFPDGWRVAISDTSHAAPGTFDHELLARNLGILRLTTGNPLDFYFADEEVAEVAQRLEEILHEHSLDAPVVPVGMSLAGTRALRLAGYLHGRLQSNEYPSAPDLPSLAAVVIVDAPLDMVRFWHAEQLAVRRDFHPAAADEGRWVSYLLETSLGGTPDTAPDAYAAYSPFSYGIPGGGNASAFVGLPIRAYHEPDVNWWIEHRRKSYYGMNSIDMAALIDELRIRQSPHAELITTCQSRPEPTSAEASPHTWSIVDGPDLARWIAERVEDWWGEAGVTRRPPP